MQAIRTYEWAQDQIDTLTGREKREHTEQRARERRLRQMESKRAKAARRRPADPIEAALAAKETP